MNPSDIWRVSLDGKPAYHHDLHGTIQHRESLTYIPAPCEIRTCGSKTIRTFNTTAAALTESFFRSTGICHFKEGRGASPLNTTLYIRRVVLFKQQFCTNHLSSSRTSQQAVRKKENRLPNPCLDCPLYINVGEVAAPVWRQNQNHRIFRGLQSR
jgi:hypothetical protein